MTGKYGQIRTFRDLIVWQRGMELAKAVYSMISRMPPSEKFELASQMWRAAYSIPSNIAEGYSRQTRPDYLKFLPTSRGSLAELATQFELATSLQIIPPNPLVLGLIEEEDRLLQALIMSLQRKTQQEQEAKRAKRARPS